MNGEALRLTQLEGGVNRAREPTQWVTALRGSMRRSLGVGLKFNL